MVPLAECAAGASDAYYTKCHPWHFFELWGVFEASPQAFLLNPVSLIFEWLLHCMCIDVVHGACPYALQHVGTLGLTCLHDFTLTLVPLRACQGPWCLQEGQLQLFGGSPCPNTTLSRVAL